VNDRTLQIADRGERLNEEMNEAQSVIEIKLQMVEAIKHGERGAKR
jgi:hypothetical protein